MLNKFVVTYANGRSEEIQSSNETAELQANSTFGMGLEQAGEMGCNVELIETIQEADEFVATIGDITSFSREKQTYAYTRNDSSDTMAAGNMVKLTAGEGNDDAKAAIDGKEVRVIDVFPLGLILDLDLSEKDVQGLNATFEQQQPKQIENPAGTPPKSTEEQVDPGLITLTHLTRDNPTTGYVNDTDVQKMKLGDTLTLKSVAGLQDMMDQADGRSGEVRMINGTNVQLGIDLSDVDTTGLVMTAIGTPINESDRKTDSPPAEDRTGKITAFTAENPTVVTMSKEDADMVDVGDFITLDALTGDPEAVTLIHGQRVDVTNKDPVTLNMDLEGYNVKDLAADFLTDEPNKPIPRKTASAPAPSQAPAPAPSPAPRRTPGAPTPSWAQSSEPVKDQEQAAKDASKPTPNIGGAPLNPAPRKK